MSNYVFAPPPPSEAENSPYVTWENGFSTQELDKISIYCEKKIATSKATIMGIEENSDYSKTRKAKTGWISSNDEIGWLYERMAWIARKANASFYKFDLYGFLEDMQYTLYDDVGDHYDWHIDSGPTDVAPRKLSMSLLLNDPSEYEGGDLQFMNSKEPKTAPRAHGLVVLFPAYRMHRVTPVTKGVRKSLVVWITGPQFR